MARSLRFRGGKSLRTPLKVMQKLKLLKQKGLLLYSFDWCALPHPQEPPRRFTFSGVFFCCLWAIVTLIGLSHLQDLLCSAAVQCCKLILKSLALIIS